MADPAIPTYLNQIREMLANHAAFRTWLGVATAALARARIHLHSLRTEEGGTPPTKPYVMLTEPQEGPHDRASVAVGTNIVTAKRAAILICNSVPAEYLGNDLTAANQAINESDAFEQMLIDVQATDIGTGYATVFINGSPRCIQKAAFNNPEKPTFWTSRWEVESGVGEGE